MKWNRRSYKVFTLPDSFILAQLWNEQQTKGASFVMHDSSTRFNLSEIVVVVSVCLKMSKLIDRKTRRKIKTIYNKSLKMYEYNAATSGLKE